MGELDKPCWPSFSSGYISSGALTQIQKRTSHRERGSGSSRVGGMGVEGGRLAKLAMLMRDLCSERWKEGSLIHEMYNKPA